MEELGVHKKANQVIFDVEQAGSGEQRGPTTNNSLVVAKYTEWANCGSAGWWVCRVLGMQIMKITIDAQIKVAMLKGLFDKLSIAQGTQGLALAPNQRQSTT